MPGLLDTGFAQWLRQEALYTSLANAGLASGLLDSAIESEIISPLAIKAAADSELARQIAVLGGPLALDRHVVKGQRRDLVGKCITLFEPGGSFGYNPGVAVFVVSAEEQDDNLTVLEVIRSLAVPNPFLLYALAMKFPTPEYWVAGVKAASLSAMAGYTFTRSGIQGAVDASGAVAFHAANVPAINSAGYHAHNALTNYILQSQALENASWARPVAGAGSSIAVTADAAAAPDGTMTAERIQAIKGGETAGHYALIQQGSQLTATGVCTASVWLKSATGSSHNVMIYTNEGGGVTSGQVVLATTAWQRFAIVYTKALTVTQYLAIGTYGDGEASLPDGSATSVDVYAWQGQILAGNFPDGGPLIATAGATASIGASALLVNDSVTSADQIFLAKADFTNASGTGVKRLATWWDGTTTNMVGVFKENAILYSFARVAAVDVYAGSATATGDVTIVIRRVGGNWRGGYIIAGVLTWFGADTAAAFPTGMVAARLGYFSVNEEASTGLKFAGRKLGTFDTDAKVLAAVAETA